MKENYYQLVADDGFGRTVLLEWANTQEELESLFHDTVESKRYARVYIVFVVKSSPMGAEVATNRVH